jgi:hypothetical protein
MTENGMTCDRFDEFLADYFEESIDAEVRSAMDAHRVGCLRCAALVRDLEGIRAIAGALPDVAPARDLWAGIAERIDREVIAVPRFRAPQALPSRVIHPAARRGSFVRWGMAAAALVAVTSGVTYYATLAQVQRGPQQTIAAATGGDTTGPVSAEVPPPLASVPAIIPSASTGGAAAVRVSRQSRLPAAVTYDREIARLRRVVAQRRPDLDPATLAVLEHSLATIDGAIAEARTALASDPASMFLSNQLDKALEKKLGVLRTAALLPSGT